MKLTVELDNTFLPQDENVLAKTVKDILAAMSLNNLAKTSNPTYSQACKITDGVELLMTKCNSVTDAMHFLKNAMRERSNGAVKATVFFMSSKTTKELYSEAGLDLIDGSTNVLFCGAKVVRDQEIKDGVVWALGKSSYTICDPSSLFTCAFL